MSRLGDKARVSSAVRVWLIWVLMVFVLWMAAFRFGLLPDLSTSEPVGYLDGVARRATGSVYYGFLISAFLGTLGYGLALWRVAGGDARTLTAWLLGTGRTRSFAHNEDAFAVQRAPLRDAVALFPALGFLGTVIGVTIAIGGLENVLDGEEPTDLITGLRTAFDTTFLGLVASLVLNLVLMAVDEAQAKRQNAMSRNGQT